MYGCGWNSVHSLVSIAFYATGIETAPTAAVREYEGFKVFDVLMPYLALPAPALPAALGAAG
jgi:hypothetical protein